MSPFRLLATLINWLTVHQVDFFKFPIKWNLWGKMQNAPQGQTLSGWGCGAIPP
jgi:hypothetical protein